MGTMDTNGHGHTGDAATNGGIDLELLRRLNARAAVGEQPEPEDNEESEEEETEDEDRASGYPTLADRIYEVLGLAKALRIVSESGEDESGDCVGALEELIIRNLEELSEKDDDLGSVLGLAHALRITRDAGELGSEQGVTSLLEVLIRELASFAEAADREI